MTGKLLAYTHPRITRAAFLAEIAAHREADRIVQRTYWEDGRGCGVGCAIESINKIAGLNLYHGNHLAYPEYLGIPLVLAYLEDCIFERLTKAESREWPLRFCSAIREGSDLNNVWPQFASWMLREIALPAAGADVLVRAAIVRVATGYETAWADDTAADAGYAADVVSRAGYASWAGYAASCAGYAASRAAVAGYAASRAAVAGYAIYAGYAADAASIASRAADAAPRTAYRKMADKLIDLLEAAK